MKDYLDKKAKKLEKQRASQPDRYKNNPAFDSTSPNSRSTDLARSRAKYEEVKLNFNEKNKYDDSFIEGETGSKRARRDMTSAMNRSGMGYAKLGREQQERQERHKADRGKKTKGTKAGHSGSVYPKRSHTMDTMYPHKKTARLKRKADAMKKEEVSFQQFQEKCWPGYEKKGMKTMFGKRYPNCVKKKK